MINQSSFRWYQLAAWITAYLLFTVYIYLRLEALLYATGIATCAFFFFATIIYTYALFIYPRLYASNKLLFFIALLALLSVLSLVRAYIEYRFISELFSRKSFFNFGRAHLSYVVVTNFVALVLGVLLKGASASIIARERQKELEKQQLMTEMKLLKAQLQPHFLFNSLNNIYYEAYKESPGAARLIEKLSAIMRFFLDISTKDKIAIAMEMQFIRNIIEMEQIRCYHAIEIKITDKTDAGTQVPPMLMTPLVENALKHGIDKKQTNNYIAITAEETAVGITFQIRNRLHPSMRKNDTPGTGLKNLKERLALLYEENYKLLTAAENDYYSATLIIPRT